MTESLGAPLEALSRSALRSGHDLARATHEHVPYARGMSVDRISVTVPAELGVALRALAESRGETVSALVSEAIARQLRDAALDAALADSDGHFGPVPEDLVPEAEAELAKAIGSRRKRTARTR